MRFSIHRCGRRAGERSCNINGPSLIRVPKGVPRSDRSGQGVPRGNRAIRSTATEDEARYVSFAVADEQGIATARVQLIGGLFGGDRTPACGVHVAPECVESWGCADSL